MFFASSGVSYAVKRNGGGASYALPLAFSIQLGIELAEEAHVVFEIEPQVAHAVFEHGDTFDAHAEGEARIFLRIDAVGLQYVGVDHAAAQNLQPTRALADRTALAAAEVARDVDLGRGSVKGKYDGRIRMAVCSPKSSLAKNSSDCFRSANETPSSM